jgi:transcriptional regulator with XRE-family HTH domain
MGSKRGPLTPLLAAVGRRMREFRETAGLGQRDLAQLADSAQARVSGIENGHDDIRITTLQRWADVLGYDVEIQFVPKMTEEWHEQFDSVISDALTEITDPMS